MLMTVKEAAALLRVSPQRLYELVRVGAVPGVRIGRQVRVDRNRLQAWIDHGGASLDSPSWRGRGDTTDDNNQ